VVSGTRTAVLIEDDTDISNLVQGILTPSGTAVRIADTGASGVNMVRNYSPDIVLLDFGLPDISGLEVTSQIRSFSSVYIFMLTGRSDLAQALIAAGADCHDQAISYPNLKKVRRGDAPDSLGRC
jgi:two-component system OmpR family response regulator